MFVEINGVDYSKYSIQDFYTRDDVVEGVTQYNIIYTLAGGIILIETFDTDSDRASKIEDLEG
jgi:hypothetical protein